MPKKFWQFRNQAAGSAELLLYGDISDSSWWGDEVTPKTFADELNALGALTSLTVRINSGGGDVFAAQTIGNLLEQHTAQVTARIDGLCASAATIIACHCDKVVAANDSTYMIHPVRMGIFDFADAVTLQQYITFDNGTEFAAAEGLERSCVNKCLPRTKVYFCHPYSSWERGTNENTNGMIRRRFPKGTNFAAVTNAQIAQAENWINNYPRKILGYKSSEIVFRECLRELGIAA